jgi:hypothetical protein
VIAHSLRPPRFAAGVAILGWLSTGCANTPREIEVVPVNGAAAAASIRSARYAKDVAAIAAAFEAALHLPPVEVPLVLFPTRRAFEQGLLELGYSPGLAQAASAFAAIGGAKAVLVNAQVVDGYDRHRRVRLLAHELVHSMQYRFGGGTRGESEQWLREGFAEWVACRVTAHLRLAPFDELREDVLSPLAAVPIGTALTPLEGLSTFEQWARAQKQSDGRLYAQAFVAAELLVEQHGIARIVHYFGRFKARVDRRLVFAESFGVDLRAFEAILTRHWHQAVARRQAR